MACNENPFPFTEQPDKWGYLNNPRWTGSPNSEKVHNPCGHWHKRSPEREYYQTNYNWWQQTCDIDGDNLAFTAVGYSYPYLFVIGKINGVWQYIDIIEFNEDGYLDYESPFGYIGWVFLLGNIIVWAHNIYTNWDSNFRIWTKPVSTGVVTSHDVFCSYCGGTGIYYYEDSDSDFIMDASETGIVTCCVIRYDDYYNVDVISRTSENFGLNWKDEVSVFNSPEGVEWPSGIATRIDADGTIWLVYGTSDYVALYLYKSTDNGNNFTLVNAIAYTGSTYYLHLFVDSTKPFISIVVYGFFPNYLQTFISTDGGTNFTNYGITLYYPNNLAGDYANGVICLYVRRASDLKYVIIRSTDYGATWSVVHVLTGNYITPYPYVAKLRGDGDNFIFTSCNLSDSTNSQLGYLLSTDKGLTWNYFNSPYSKGVGPTVVVRLDPFLPDAQVWTLP